MSAILGCADGFPQTGKHFLHPPALDLDLAVFPQGRVGGIEDQKAVRTVKQYMIAGLQLFGNVFQADHGGDVKRPSHDRGMGSSATNIGCKPQDHLPVQRRGVGRRDVMSNNDLGRLQIGEGPGGSSKEVSNDATGNVMDIECALAEVGVVNFTQRTGISVRDLGEDKLDVVSLSLQRSKDFIDQGTIFDHEKMSIE